MPPQKTTIQLELTGAQKAHAPTAWVPGAATGRSVNVLDLRLQGGLEPAAGQEGEAEPEIPARPDKKPVPEPAECISTRAGNDPALEPRRFR